MNWLKDFPFTFPFKLAGIDRAVRAFSIRFEPFFLAIRNFLTFLVNSIQSLLDHIPWFVLIILVFLAGWKLIGDLKKGLLYSLLLICIGAFGFWGKMNETLAIVIASLIISLIFGFPLGILISMSERADSMARPILDTMQTMPVFVYLIPALLFFGLGKAPSVIATTIYAIVPIIRLTNLGIRQIDRELIEAAQAFGATKLQSLMKVEIPQALPTIMTGVNQTLMMAISMVVTTSMIGSKGLGMEVLIGVQRIEIGRGLVSGMAIVIIAIILDRITQSLIRENGV